MGVVHSVCIFLLLSTYICLYCIRKITVFLARSDSTGNSLSVPQLTSVLCRCPVLNIKNLTSFIKHPKSHDTYKTANIFLTVIGFGYNILNVKFKFEFFLGFLMSWGIKICHFPLTMPEGPLISTYEFAFFGNKLIWFDLRRWACCLYRQFSCAALTEPDVSSHSGKANGGGVGEREVWVCNSDGYVGHMCLLSLQSEPIVTLNTPLPGCNSRITCICSAPPAVPLQPQQPTTPVRLR